MIITSFNADNLKKVYTEKMKEREQNIMMGYLREYVDNLCNECVSDRMGNVLSPKCRRRFLINTRILSGAQYEELPLFCYNQVISNLQRYIAKKTTLFTPVDVIIYNNDFFELFFPKLSKKIIKLWDEEKIKEVNSLIEKSKIPANYSKARKDKPGLLRNILKLDKVIREGSFIYDNDPNYFVVWAQSTLYVANLKKGYTICNVHREKIDSTEILDMILPLYAEGKDFELDLVSNGNDNPNINISIAGKILIKYGEEVMNQKFSEITEEISHYSFPRSSFNLVKDHLEISVEVDSNCTYDDINRLFNTLGTLSEIENINLLTDIKET